LDKTAEMRSDQYWWKKLGERDDLDLFLSAYAEATGESLTVAEEGETPDFVCERENGLRVGVELTKIIAHPETRRWHRLFGFGPLNCGWDVGSRIFEASYDKAKKLHKSKRWVSENILVIQLFDNPLTEIRIGLEQIDNDEFIDTGFEEIWISDHSTIDAFGDVDLFGIYPEHLAGYYGLTVGRKPYG